MYGIFRWWLNGYWLYRRGYRYEKNMNLEQNFMKIARIVLSFACHQPCIMHYIGDLLYTGMGRV